MSDYKFTFTPVRVTDSAFPIGEDPLTKMAEKLAEEHARTMDNLVRDVFLLTDKGIIRKGIERSMLAVVKSYFLEIGNRLHWAWQALKGNYDRYDGWDY